RLLVASACGFARPAAVFAAALRAAPAPPALVPLLVARALDDAGDRDGARAALEEAVARAPRSLPLLEARRHLPLPRGGHTPPAQRGAPPGAARPLERAVAVAPGDARIASFAGLLPEDLGGPAPVIAEYRRLLRFDPPGSPARDDLAALLLRQSDQIDEALLS